MRRPPPPLALALLLLAAAAPAAPRCPPQPPAGHGAACSAAPEALPHSGDIPGGGAPVAQGRYFWYDDRDNQTVCACALTPIAKCCPDGYAVGSGKCVSSSLPFRPVVTGANGNVLLTYYEDVNMVDCEKPVRLDSSYILGLTAAGQLNTTNVEELVEPRHFCLDDSLDGGGGQYVLLCYNATAPPGSVAPVVFASSLLASSAFLAATVAAHVWLAPLRGLHGRVVCCYALSRLLCQVTIAAYHLSVVDDDGCQAVAFITYFSELASYFWLNVMYFDLFWTFSGFCSSAQRGRHENCKKFIIYCVYSWGCPLIFLSVTLVMQYHSDIPDGLVRPQIDLTRCWFIDDKITDLVYVSGPVGVLFLCNIILIILTTIRNVRLKRETAVLEGTDSRRLHNDKRRRFYFYLKISVFMSVSFLLGAIAQHTLYHPYSWFVIDACNVLQSVFIFVAYICRDSVRHMLMEKFCPKRATTARSGSATPASTRESSPSPLSHGVLNNNVTHNINGDVTVTVVTRRCEDNGVP